MKKSIKVAALALFATSLLGGCSNGGPAEQKITVSPESLVVYTGESFTLESNVSNATWSLEENDIGARLSAVEGKSVQVSATIAGTVVAVAKAEGYTTPKVTLTFEYRSQQISVTPASGEVFRDESFTLETNASTATWSLEGNTAGATLSAESGKNVSVSATGAGVAVAVATADGYTQAKVTLKFNELKDQTISSNPESGEVFVGKSISLSTNADIAGWTLSDNTAGAVLDISSGKTVTVTGSAIGSVTVTAKAANYKDAALRLSFVEPHWTDEEEAIMEENLYGQVIPYAQGAGDLMLASNQGMIRVSGSSPISPENLAAFAALFTAADGWVAQESESEYEYMFEKCIPTAEGNRYVFVDFGSFDASFTGIANGDFVLIAYDPYVYEFPTFDFELAKVTLEIESEVEVPALQADHYSFNEKYSAALVYSVEEADLEAAYSAVLAQSSDFVDYGHDDSLGVCVAEEKSGAFSLMYYQLDSTCLVIQMEKGAIYQHEWPAELLAQYCSQVLGSETVVPAFVAPRYYAEYLAKYGIIGMTCYDFESETPIEDYAAILVDAGWTYFGDFKSGSSYVYLADSPDGKVGVQFNLSEEGNLEIYVAENNFDHKFPAEQFAEALAAQGIETEVSVPGVEAGGYNFFNDEDGAGVYCYLVKEDPTAAYLQALVDAGWSIFDISEEGMTIYAADASDYSFGIQFTYFAEEEVFAIFLSDTYRNYGHEWPENYAMLISVLVFQSEDILPDPQVEAEWYILDFDYPRFTLQGVESDPSESYTAILQEAGFNLLPSEESEGLTMYFANSSDLAYGVAYWYENGNFNIQMTDPFNVELDEFPVDEIAKMFAGYGIQEVSVPKFDIASEEGYFELDTAALKEGAYVVYAFGATSEEYSNYIESFEDAGWIIVDQDNGEREYSKDVILQYGETYAYCEIMDYVEEHNAVAFAFYYEEPVITEFPTEEIVAYLAGEGYNGEVNLGSYVIASEDGSFELEEDDGLYVYANNSTVEELAGYIDQLQTLGWTIVKPGSEQWPNDVTMAYGETGVYLQLADYVDDGYVMMCFYFVEPPVAEFPSEKIKASLEALGAPNDTLPVFSGEASGGFKWISPTSSGNSQLSIIVGAGNEATALETYIADLLAAGYTEAGEDKYGDMHYTSPNGELDVCPWDGSKYGSAGYVVVDVVVNKSAQIEFPLEEVNAFLSTNEFGFQLTQALVDPSGDGYTIEYSDNGGYPVCDITVNGDAFDEDLALLIEILTAAGYQSYEDYYQEGVFAYYYNENYSSVVIYYNAETGTTLVSFTA